MITDCCKDKDVVYIIEEDDPYIESDGTSAINLGISASPKLKVEIDYELTDVTDPTPDGSNHYQQRLFGEDTTSATPRMSVYVNGSKIIAVATGDGWDAKSTGVTADFRRHTVIIDNVAAVRALMTGVTTNWSDTCTDVTKCATRPLALLGNTAMHRVPGIPGILPHGQAV